MCWVMFNFCLHLFSDFHFIFIAFIINYFFYQYDNIYSLWPYSFFIALYFSQLLYPAEDLKCPETYDLSYHSVEFLTYLSIMKSKHIGIHFHWTKIEKKLKQVGCNMFHFRLSFTLMLSNRKNKIKDKMFIPIKHLI